MEDGRRGGWYTSTSLSLNAAATPPEETGGREEAGPGSPDIRLSPSSAATSIQGKDRVYIQHELAE